uniref:Uncharacterized protein n=1 Tax=viral metagenome TaxID=1070528 RepID=A0A6C0KV75_9ZZZZ
MDDFNVSSLHESKNEWGSRLLTILTPHIIEGLRSIFDEAFKLCKENDELDKYLMTFQNFITRIPKWNPNIIETEKKRIIEKSNCGHLEDLITCVHIIQLKILTAMRAGQKQKKIDVNIPKLDDFIHKVYINVARKVYKNVYLFEIGIPPLQIQKNNRELEIIVQECILTSVRESIPIETILRAYMDETVEEDVVEEIKEQEIEDPEKKKIDEQKAIAAAAPPQIISEVSSTPVVASEIPDLLPDNSTKLTFNDIDMARDVNNVEEQIIAPKDDARLEKISEIRNAQRKAEEEGDDDDDYPLPKLKIFDQNVSLDNLDVHVIGQPEIELIPDLLIDDIEVLS